MAQLPAELPTLDRAPAVDVCVVLFASADCVADCLLSVPEAARVILVENQPLDGSVEAALASRPEATVLRPGRNLGFGGACNLALCASHAPFVLMLNPDATLDPDCLDLLVGYLQNHPRCAGVGPLVLRSSDRRIDSAGMEILAPGWTRDRCRGLDANQAPAEGVAPALSAGVLLLRREALENSGRFPEAFWTDLFLYNEDVELCMALKRGGWELHFLPCAKALHAVGGSHPPRRPIRAMAARNRLVTGIVHCGWHDLLRPRGLFRWLWRIAMDTPRLVDNFRLPELRAAFWPLVRQIPARRDRLRGKVR